MQHMRSWTLWRNTRDSISLRDGVWISSMRLDKSELPRAHRKLPSRIWRLLRY